MGQTTNLIKQIKAFNFVLTYFLLTFTNADKDVATCDHT